MVFKVVGKGHEIGLKMQYPYDTEKEYEIEVRKHGDPLKRSQSQFLLFAFHELGSDADHFTGRIERGLRRHDTIDLLEDTLKIGIVSGFEVGGHALGHITGGGVIEDSRKKFNAGLDAKSRSSGMMLSGDN